MVKKDLKKVAHISMRHETADQIVIVRHLKHITQEKKDELVHDLLAKKKTTEMNKEEKETAKEVPELEKENYKRDKALSSKEKLENWWKKEETIWATRKITVLKKDFGDDACVREYLDDGVVPKQYVGEQKFTPKAVDLLNLRKRLPNDSEEFQKIVWDDPKAFLQEYFFKDGKLFLSGARRDTAPYKDQFVGINNIEEIYLWDWTEVTLHSMPTEYPPIYSHKRYARNSGLCGYSLRLKKAA